MFKIGAASLAVSTATAALAFSGAGAASATQRHLAPGPAHTTACAVASRNYGFPKIATTFPAGPAGSVTIRAVNSGTISVMSVHPAKGWSARVDSASGSSVDVYFRHGPHTLKFETEINDWGGLTVAVTSC